MKLQTLFKANLFLSIINQFNLFKIVYSTEILLSTVKNCIMRIYYTYYIYFSNLIFKLLYFISINIRIINRL